ncbi:Phospholipase ABHD3 [Taenia crassiceps]|uniref:Phospholipase ABHD3 n=1 Tax=Taenia crassiceps TaxID=6207 RepID=A0ABR4QIY4_9CEST
MAAVGISFGALLLFNYLADEPQDLSKPCPLTAAMCVSMPWDASQSSDKLEKSLDWLLFNYPLTYSLRQLVMRNADVLSKKYDIPRVLKSRSVREFDENLTVGMFGYKSVDEFYAHASPATKIDRIHIPLLCLNAADDPFVPFSSLPLDAVNTVDSRVVLALTRHGGHIGFLAGFLPTRPTLLDRAVPQFVSAVFQHPEDFSIAAATEDVNDNKTESEDGDTNPTKETTTTFY